MNNEKISQVGERKLIKHFLKKRDKLLDNTNSVVYKSYYDDAALEVNDGKYTVLSTDMLIEHTHFPKSMTYYQMGEKIVTVNVSDILATNAIGTSILISMALPPSMTIEDFDKLTDGILHKCQEYHVKLIGGDINENDEIILSATAIGKIDEDVKLQTNIEVGDLIAVTGNLGTPAAALDLINNDMDIPQNVKDEIIDSILEPDLPIDTFKTLHENPQAITSMTDITDGLAIELDNIKDKNPDIGFELYYDRIPYNRYIEEIAKYNNKELEEYLFHFGEEFELLLTLNPTEYEKISSDLNLHIIGKSNDTHKITLVKDGMIKDLKIKGYEHLKE